MGIKHEVELMSFTVPDHVHQKRSPGLKQDGFKELPSYTMSDLSSESLDELCAEFRREVFAKSGSEDPYPIRKKFDVS